MLANAADCRRRLLVSRGDGPGDGGGRGTGTGAECYCEATEISRSAWCAN